MMHKEEFQRPLLLSFTCWLIIVCELFVLSYRVLIYPLNFMSPLFEMRPLWNIPDVFFHICFLLLHGVFFVSAIIMLKQHRSGRVLLLVGYPLHYILSFLALGGHVEWWPFCIMTFCLFVLVFLNPAATCYFTVEQKMDGGLNKGLKVRVVMAMTFITLLGTAYWTLTEWVPKNPMGILCFYEIIPSEKLLENLTFSEHGDVLSTTLLALHKRRDPSGLEAAIALLDDERLRVWEGAAEYLGSYNRTESVPYLIKKLQRDEKDCYSRAFLPSITGENFRGNFERWKMWWEKSHPDINFDWEASLRGQCFKRNDLEK